MSNNLEKVGSFVANVIDTLDDEVVDSTNVGAILIIIELQEGQSESSPNGATILRLVCNDKRTYVQKGLMQDTLDCIRDSELRDQLDR